MIKVIFYGWVVGMEKIPFIKLLHEKANLSLKEAKMIKDGIVDGKEYVIEIKSLELANEIIIKAQSLGVKCKIINS